MAESDKLRKSNEKDGRKSISPPRVAKGPRPYFFDDANVDKLLAMIMALAGEVSVLRERLDTHERLAKTQTWADTDNIEAYEPAAEIKLERVEEAAGDNPLGYLCILKQTLKGTLYE